MTNSADLDSIHYFNSVPDIISFIKEYQASQIIFLCDFNTRIHCFEPYFTSLGFSLIGIPDGDMHKNMENVAYICEKLLMMQADRDTLLVNLGGGMICDIGGFVASVFKRGIRFVNIPTTTLAMADAAFGGKTAVNLGQVKNAIGTFKAAESVCICPDFIKTLPKREQKSGFAELVKMALLFDAGEWNLLSQFSKIPAPGSPELTEAIRFALQAKKKVVMQDLYEKDLRKSLNYGHSIGHAIEAVYNQSGEKMLHGEAVFWGMQLENLIGVRVGIMEETERQKIAAVLNVFHPLPESLQEVDAIMESLLNDKKNKSGKILMTLLEKPGKFILNAEVSPETVFEVLTNFNRL
ncbi:MAG: 3-dehydroquinate synthase [Bacteroidia bacterium]|nr:3-dehydroquinate synthase [Bacteroidia bacterium]